MANALDFFHVLLKHLCKCLHNGQQLQIPCDSSSSRPKLKGQGYTKRSKLYPPSAKIPVAESSVATTFNIHLAFHRADSPKPVTPSAGELTIAVFMPARLRMATCHLKYPTESERSALVPLVKVKPHEYESAPRLDDIVQQGNARRTGSARTSWRVKRAAAKESSFETLTPRLKYQEHIEELEYTTMPETSRSRDPPGLGQADEFGKGEPEKDGAQVTEWSVLEKEMMMKV